MRVNQAYPWTVVAEQLASLAAKDRSGAFDATARLTVPAISKSVQFSLSAVFARLNASIAANSTAALELPEPALVFLSAPSVFDVVLSLQKAATGSAKAAATQVAFNASAAAAAFSATLPAVLASLRVALNGTAAGRVKMGSVGQVQYMLAALPTPDWDLSKLPNVEPAVFSQRVALQSPAVVLSNTPQVLAFPSIGLKQSGNPALRPQATLRPGLNVFCGLRLSGFSQMDNINAMTGRDNSSAVWVEGFLGQEGVSLAFQVFTSVRC